jgi:hypothetical protein
VSRVQPWLHIVDHLPVQDSDGAHTVGSTRAPHGLSRTSAVTIIFDGLDRPANAVTIGMNTLFEHVENVLQRVEKALDLSRRSGCASNA